MIEYLLKRLGMALFTLFIILLISYTLARLAPGDPSKSSMLEESGSKSSGDSLSAEKKELGVNQVMRKKLHLDKPVYVGFSLWLKDVLTKGDFGTSVAVDKGRPVTALILEKLPVTIHLNAWAILITYILAIPLGIYSCMKSGTKTDNVLTFFLFLLYSLPGFWVALLVQATLCKGGHFPIFPLKGLAPSGGEFGISTWQTLLDSSKYYILPVFCLSYAGFASLSRFVRAGMIDVSAQDFIRTARAKGLPEYLVVLRHTFMNSLIIMITLFAGLLPGLVSGSIFIEYVFNIPGMGFLSMVALTSRDIPVMMALFAFGGALTLAGILLADIMYVLADPRISFKARI